MLVEAFVLCCHKRMHKIRRNFGIGDHDTVFLVQIPSAHHFPVSRIDLRGIPVDGILQVFYVGHISYPTKPNGNKSQRGSTNDNRKNGPQKMYKSFSHYILN